MGIPDLLYNLAVITQFNNAEQLINIWVEVIYNGCK